MYINAIREFIEQRCQSLSNIRTSILDRKRRKVNQNRFTNLFAGYHRKNVKMSQCHYFQKFGQAYFGNLFFNRFHFR